jgi:PDZ domain
MATSNPPAISTILTDVIHTGFIPQIETIAGAIEAVAPKLTTDQSEAALDAILHAMFSWSLGGWLGVGYQDAISETAAAIAADEPRGVVVTQVASRSPAQSADIRAGDIITAFDGTTIDQATALTRLVGKAQPGKEVVVTVWRRGEKKDLTLTLGEQVMRLGEGVEDGMRLKALTAMADALKALPVPLTADQFQMVSRGFRKVTRQYGDQTRAPGAMAEVVEALAPKLTDAAKADMLSEMHSILTAGSGDTDVRWARAYEALLPPSSAEYYERAKADMLSAVRSILGAVGSGDAAVRWAKVYESLLTPSPPEYYIGSIAEVLKYPTSYIKKRRPSDDELRRNPEEYETLSATEYFQKKMSQKFQDAKELQSGKLMDLLDWVAKNYPEIDLVRPPIRPNLS